MSRRRIVTRAAAAARPVFQERGADVAVWRGASAAGWNRLLTPTLERNHLISQGHDREATCAAVTGAIAADVSNVNLFPIKARKLGTGEDVTASSWLAYALNVMPSPAMSAQTVRAHYSNAMEYAGESYLLRVGNTLTPLVGGTVEVLPAKPGETYADGSPKLVSGYLVKRENGETVATYAEPGPLVRIHYPHPLDPIKPNSKVAQAGLAIDTLHAHRLSTKSILINSGHPSGIVSVVDPDGGQVAEEDLLGLEQRLASKWSTPEHKGGPLVVDGTRVTYTEVDAAVLGPGWAEAGKLSREDVYRTWAMPAARLGETGGMTFENQATALGQWYSQTILPSLQLLCSALNNLARAEGYELYVDTTGVAVLQEDEGKRVERAAKAYTSQIARLNEARRMLGLPPVEGPEGEAFYVPTQRTPGGAPGGAPDGPPGLTDDGGEEERGLPFVSSPGERGIEKVVELTEEQVAAAASTILRLVDRSELRLSKYLSGVLRKVVRRAETRLEALYGETLEATVPAGLTVEHLFDRMGVDVELRAGLTPLFEDAAREVSEATGDALGGDLPESAEARWKRVASQRVSRLVEGVDAGGKVVYRGWSQGVRDVVEKRLVEGYENGWSARRLRDALRSDLVGVDPSGDLLKIARRAELTARTEINGLASQVQWETADVSGRVREKKWYSIGNGRTRDTHRAANGQVRAFREPFLVGGVEMMHPHDPSAPAREVIQCRCRWVASKVVLPETFGGATVTV